MDPRNDCADSSSGAIDISLRAVMACFPTGVTIVSTCDQDDVPRGLTVNAFTSVSLNPPLVLVCVECDSRSHDHIIQADGFVINILSAEQAELAERFARYPSDGRFDGLAWEPAPSGHPVLEGSVAWLDCATKEVISAGDHSIIIGQPNATGSGTEPALVFHRGTLGSIG